MKRRTTLFGLAAAITLAALPVLAQEQPPATEADMAKWFHEDAIVDYAFMTQYAVLPKQEGVMIVDSRPTKMWDVSHIPTAVTMPDSDFETLSAGVLPEAKDQLLIFYCGGYACALSHNSAFKAEAAGYTNIKVYAAGLPDWTFQGGVPAVSTLGLQQLQAGEDPVLVVDSRPTAKITTGVIPNAISIPDSKFDKFAGMLPADKATKLVFYCGGFMCDLSEKSAYKAMALGYTNVSTYPAGEPAWKAEVGILAVNVNPTGEGAAMPAVVAANEGAINIEEALKYVAEQPDNVLFVDVRDPDEFAAAHITGAINIPVNTMEDEVFNLPTDKKIIFTCARGGRSGEAYDTAKLLMPDLDVWFLNAITTYHEDGTIEAVAAN